MATKTPANKWKANGEADPHGTYYTDTERANLPLGDYTDDELANAVFLYGNAPPDIDAVITGKAKMPIVYLQAAKDRIRWLSRKVCALQEKRTQDELDAARFRWLMDNSVGMRRADREGPECPKLELYVDLWNEQYKLSPQERIISHIDQQISQLE